MGKLDGLRVRTRRRNGQIVEGVARWCACLAPIGDYYTIMMDNPVAYDVPDGGAVFYYERRKNRVRDEMTCYGTYNSRFLTII